MPSLLVDAAIPIVAAISGLAGWLLQRRITGARHTEDADSIKQAVEFQKFLTGEGLSLSQARQLRDNLRDGRQPITPAMAQAISERQPIPDLLTDEELSVRRNRAEFRDTTVGMKLGLAVRLQQLDAAIDYLLAEIAHDSTPARAQALDAAQNAWKEFRSRDAEAAALLWEGGSGAPLLGLSRQVEMSEQRMNELELMKAEEAAL